MNSYTDRQITDWRRGLLTVAWADGLEINDPRLARLLCQFIPA
jgi:hypothetical protein